MNAILDGAGNDLTQGGIVAVVSVILVFAILGIIILITSFVGSLVREATESADEEPKKQTENGFEGIDTEDEDAVVAMLVASIDYRNETHKNIRVVSVREIK